MRLIGICAYCGEEVVRGSGLRNRAPVRYVKGFGEERADGGINALHGGAVPVRGFESKVWHLDCAIEHRDELRRKRGYVPPDPPEEIE